MKKIFKALSVFIAIWTLLLACENLDPNFEMLTTSPDPNASYYLQFIDAAQSLETGVTEAGELVEIQTTIGVVLMGMPQSQDITVNLTVDAATTIASDMYTLSANSITIPAGKTSGSVDFTTVAENMPVGQTLQLVVNIDAGEHNSPNPAGTALNYKLKRIEFCPLVNGINDLVGSWSGDDGGWSSIITTSVNGTKLDATGMGQGFIAGFWDETVVDGGTCTLTVYGNGMIDIPRQYIFTTVYDGSNYDYEIAGSGKWENCGDAPHLLLTYDIYYPGDAKGLAASYSAYYGASVITADITLSGAKSGEIIKLRPIKAMERK
jgi:hypothetical protein